MPSDPGLQAERTALAWHRTGVAGVAVAASALLAAAHLAPVPVLLAITAVTVLSAVAVEFAARAGRAEARSGIGPGTGSPWLRLLAVGAVPVLVGLAGVLLALASQDPS